MSDRMQLLAGLSVLAFVAATGATPALAQSASGPGQSDVATAAAVDEDDSQAGIIVTARKRDESLQEVPLAITAFTAAQIEDAGIKNIEDVARLTPGFTFTPLFGGNQSTPVIRGLSTTIGEPNVGFFVDGVYQSSRAVMDSLLGDDIARIEVVKGPQSALYGRNTFGGAINYVTRTPTNDFGGRIQATIGNYEQREARVSLSGPIAQDTAFFSLGASYVHKGGFYPNTLTGGDLDNYTSKVFTGGLELRPAEGLRIRLRAGFEDTDQRDYPNRFATSNAVPAQPAGPAFPPAFQLAGGTVEAFDSFAVTPGFNNRKFALGSLTIDADIGDHTLTAITGYTDLNFDTATDLDYEARRIRYQTQRIRQREYSQEIRFASPSDQPITYLAGAYYYRLRADTLIDDRIAEDAAPIAAAIPASLRRQLQGGVVNQLDEETDSFALFALIAGHIGDRLTLTAEGRYTWETKRVNATDTAQFGGAVGNFNDEAKFRNFVPRFTIDYKVSDDVLLYASAAKAVKVGGFNVVTVSGAILDSERSYRPESSWNYEVGVKASALDGTLTANADLFLIKWDDQIVRALGATFAVLNANAGKTTSKGAELELHMRPTRGLDVSAGFAYTDARYDRYIFGALAQLGVDPVLDGKPLQYVSKYTASAAIQYDRQLSDSVSWFGRADISLRSRQSAVQPANSFIGDAAVVNLRTGVTFGGLEFRLFVDNVTKEDASPSALYIPSAAARFDFVRGAIGAGPRVGFQAFGALVQSREPRTYGATLSYKF